MGSEIPERQPVDNAPRRLDVEVRPFNDADAAAIASMCGAEGWDFWSDVDAVGRALSAPGVMTLVATEGRRVVGAVQVLSDGEINWIVGALIVAREDRGQGIGTRLVSEALARTGARRLDLLTEDDGPSFYQHLGGREMRGFRLYPSP